MTDKLTIRSHEELIAYVPHVLGFTPQSSMVCVALGGGPTARLDLPDSPDQMDDWVQQLTPVYRREPHPSRVALIAYGHDAKACTEALGALNDALTAGSAGPDMGPVLWVDGDDWLDVLDGSRGTVSSSVRNRVDAEMALLGHAMPATDRADLAAALHGDSRAVAELLPAARSRTDAMTRIDRTTEVAWIGHRIDEFVRDGTPFSDTDAARAIAAVDHGAARNAAETRMTCASASTHSALWRDLVRRAPADERDSAAALLALSSYLEGKGAQAWVAIDLIARDHPLAQLVTMALEQAINPRQLEHALQPTTAAPRLNAPAPRSQPRHTGMPDQSRPNPPTPGP